MDSVGAPEVTEMRLGKRTEEHLAEAEKPHRQAAPYAHSPPPIRFNEPASG